MSIEAMKQVKQELEHIKQYGYATDIDHAIKTLGQAIVEAQKPEPTKLFGPNLEQILNAAGFYKRDAVCCGDYKKCIEPCTPKGEWLAKQELAKPEPVTWAETNDLVCALLRQAHDVLACASYPFKRPWVDLTNDEAAECWTTSAIMTWKRIQEKLKEKNNG